MNEASEREAFKAWARSRGLDVSEVPDPWGQPKFKHEHIGSIWYGWKGRAAVPAVQGDPLTQFGPGLGQPSKMQDAAKLPADGVLASPNDQPKDTK